ncbi:elongation factor G [Rhizorhabdus dicambivorans]|uniref:Elongation factor G n=1 Tax=Rhizorhabdus dicambivorans TaxID=1850238 RepID=A0A2A4FNJ6_9SPHN|nr:elongation factor G [Rhizorhabdus dicambivorans]ATE64786.1 elongation factor G [Rhizorhabdus dicambivorans]PCE39727.1 elongation factor G [Rhizorhabdus dicambivorans]
MKGHGNGTRAVALVGPAGAGKTSLAESLLFAAGAIPRLGAVSAGSSVGDASPEARARGGSTELNLMNFGWMGDRFALIDAPGSTGFAADAERALSVADLAIVVVDPDPARAALVEPTLRQLEAMRLPHALFVNKIDQARGHIQDLLEALQPESEAALVARQIPIRAGEKIDGFVDLALERAYHYRPGQPSEPIPLAADLRDVEASARFHMLEQLADHDDVLLEQLLTDEVPSLDTIFGDIARETAAGLIVPVLFGSAINGFGVRRLLKMLRHDTPDPALTAERLGIEGPAAQIFKVSHGSSVGRLALARLFGGPLAEGADLRGCDGRATRAGSLFAVQGANTAKIAGGQAGDIVGIAKIDALQAGDRVGTNGKAPAAAPAADPPVCNCAVAIGVSDHKDEVRLSGALNRLVEEDPGLHWGTDEATRQTLLHGLNDEHLNTALARLKRRYGVAVSVQKPSVAYKETIRKPVRQHGRHKKQSGGHGQFGDVIIEIRPLERGEGFRFEDRITGGAIPRQWIPAVEAGVRDAMAQGPHGFPVVDVAVTLVDGSYHSVDSSELAFRTAGRIAMAEALAGAAPYLLEPVSHVTIWAPGSAVSRITSAVSSRRGQMLGVTPREGWSRWDVIELLLPEGELHGLEAELRSLSQGLASYEAHFDHLAEVTAKLAGTIAQRTPEMA